MSYYDYQYVSLAEAWGRVPKYSKYSFYRSDKNDYGQTFTSFDSKGPQLDREYNRGYQKLRNPVDNAGNPEPDKKGSFSPSRRYTIREGDVKPSPPLRDTVPSAPFEENRACDEYLTKLNYSKSGYPNTYVMEYFQNTLEKEKSLVRFYNKAIIILLLGFLIKWLLDSPRD